MSIKYKYKQTNILDNYRNIRSNKRLTNRKVKDLADKVDQLNSYCEYVSDEVNTITEKYDTMYKYSEYLAENISILQDIVQISNPKILTLMESIKPKDAKDVKFLTKLHKYNLLESYLDDVTVEDSSSLDIVDNYTTRLKVVERRSKIEAIIK